MKPVQFTAALSASVLPLPKVATLRSAAAFADGVTVDTEKSAILNAAVMTIGDAEGHGFRIDAKTLDQVASLINAQPGGIPVRFKHPSMAEPGEPMPDTLGSDVGYVRNARVAGNSVRGDVYLADYAEVLPGLGNVKDYLLRKAKSDPTGFGLSAVIGYSTEDVRDASGNVTALVARVSEVQAVDFVSRPAANPNGLLSSKPATPPPAAQPRKEVSPMDPKMKQYMVDHHGLAADATDEQAQAAFNALSADDQAKCKGSMMSAKTPETPPTQLAAKREPTALDTQKAALAAEGERVVMLRQLGETLNVDAQVITLAIANGEDVNAARLRYLAHLKEKCKPVEGLGAVRVGEDKRVAALSVAMPQAICMSAGIGKFYASDQRGRVLRDANGAAKPQTAHELAEKYVGLHVPGLYRQWLVQMGAPADHVYSLSDNQMFAMLGARELRRHFPQIAQLAQSTSDFANILLDAQNKSMRMGYVEAARTWNVWAKRGTAPDFKNIYRTQTSELSTLVSRAEGQPIKYTTLTDSKETFALAEYGMGVVLTRRALINDDLNALTDVPMKQGQAAARLEDDVAYAILTANANLADGGALFNATAYTVGGTGHANRQSSTGSVGAPTVATVSATEKLVMLQKGPKAAAILNLTPKFWLGPVALKTTAEQFFASRVDPSKSNETPNPYNGKITPISNARLDASSAVIWYLLCDYRDGQIDTIEVCFLADEPEPRLKQETDFDTDDQKYAVTHTVAAKALDFRGMAQNDGA